MDDSALVAEAKSLVDAIAAAPRFAGSAEERKARELCAQMLKGAGFTTREVPFDYSQWPGRFGIPLIAGVLLFVIVGYAAIGVTWPAHGGIRTHALDLQGMLFALTYMGFSFVHKRRDSATSRLVSYRTTSANLEAVRGEPHLWLVAHLDSKSQSIPMLVRVGSYVALSTLVFITVAIAFMASFGWIENPHWMWIAALGVIVALPSLLCFVGNKSRGALDNASGVAAVLLAARQVSKEKPFGVLITSAEELDLAGARAWSANAHKGAMMINCDTVDDEGAFRCMFVNRPHKLGMAAENAAKKLGLGLRMGKVIPGIITDSMAFEAAGLPSVTLSRGTLHTLARLHTSGDSPDRLTGTGVAAAALLLAQMVEELA